MNLLNEWHQDESRLGNFINQWVMNFIHSFANIVWASTMEGTELEAGETWKETILSVLMQNSTCRHTWDNEHVNKQKGTK